jgi:hypothetical protein
MLLAFIGDISIDNMTSGLGQDEQGIPNCVAAAGKAFMA